MPWFRFRRRKDDQAAEAATAPEEVTAPAEALAAEEAEKAEEAEGPTRLDRRHGSRASAAAAGAEGKGAPQARRRRRFSPQSEQVAGAAGGTQRRSSREGEGRPRRNPRALGPQRTGGRERQAPAPTPGTAARRRSASSSISVDVGEQRVALLEDDRVAEVYLERPERRSIAGNIYVGTVDNVLPGMEAAFVEIGLEKNGFLYVDEIVVPSSRASGTGRRSPT